MKSMDKLYRQLHSVTFDKSGIRKELFFSTDKNFYYTYSKTFNQLFRLLVLKLNIIRPDLLQSGNKMEREKERNKLIIMEQAIQMGEGMIRESHDELFGGLPNSYMSCFFYIRRDSKDIFLKKILLPLLNSVRICDEEGRYLQL